MRTAPVRLSGASSNRSGDKIAGSNVDRMLSLSGALFNQDAVRRLQVAERHLSRLRRTHDLNKPATREVLPLHHAALRRETLAVLASAGQSMMPSEVCQRVEMTLGREIRYGSVVSLLWREAQDPTSAIIRTGRGHYIMAVR